MPSSIEHVMAGESKEVFSQHKR